MLVGDRKAISVSQVRIIFQNRRVKISVAMKSLAARFKVILASGICNFRCAIQRGKTTRSEFETPVPSCRWIFFRG